MKVVGVADLGLSMDDDGKKVTEETGNVGRRAVSVLIDPGATDIILHLISSHSIGFKGNNR